MVYYYSGFAIKTETDYKEILNSGQLVDSIDCEVYSARDAELKHCLGNFNAMYGFEYDEMTAEGIEGAIRKVIDYDKDYYQSKELVAEVERKVEILGEALGYISEIQDGQQLYSTLSNRLGMTDNEIEDFGFDYLIEFMDQSEEQDEGMILS